MTNGPIKYVPRARFYHRPKPTHPAFIHSFLSDDMITQSTVAPGKRDNLVWVTLRPEESIDDPGMPGNESGYSKYRPPVIMLNSGIRWSSKEAQKDWKYTPSPQEEEWRNYALTDYRSKLFDLELIENPTEEDIERKKLLTKLINQIGVKGEGYLETVFDLLGTSSAGISWGLAAANIPVTVTTAFKSQKNRSQCFRFKRLEAPEDQVRFSFTIEIGNGNSMYALVMGEDGISATFIHYRNMSASKRENLIAQLEAIKDNGRLTVDDRTQIAAWERQIKKIRRDSKLDGNKTLTKEENKKVSELQKKIETLKDSKRGLTDADNTEKQQLENDLYISREDFDLVERSKSTIGRTIDLSFSFLRSGFVLITSDDGRKIYENKRLTGGVPAGAEPVYGNGLPDGAYITVKSDGGMWSLVYGNKQHDYHGTIWGQPIEVPFVFDSNEVTWAVEKDEANTGCKITYDLVELQPPALSVWGTFIPGIYQVQIDFYSDYDVPDDKFKGRYTPELYYLELRIPAGETQVPQLLWDSEDPANKFSNGESRLIDMHLQDDRERSRVCSLFVANGRNHANLPELMGGLACSTSLVRTSDGGEEKVMTYGFTSSVTHDQIDYLGTADEHIQFTPSYGSKVQIEVGGCENFLSVEVTQANTGNNKYVGDYLREMCIDEGIPPELYSSLPVGAASNCPKIHRTIPGKFPDCRPSLGVNLWDWMRDVVAKHAPRWELWTDENGIRLTKKADRLRPDLPYSTSAPIGSKLRPRRRSTESGGLKLVQDLREYYTSATFIGAKDPLTGNHFVGYAEIPQATLEIFKDSMFYTGVENHYYAPVDESLKSNAECDMAAREKLNITPNTPDGLTPWTLTWKIDYDSTVKAGDVPTFNEAIFMLEGTEFASINAEDETGQQMIIFGRLAEDKKVILDG